MLPVKQKTKAPSTSHAQQSNVVQKSGDGDFFSAASEASFIQAKLTVGASDDHYEREADSVADKVVSGQKAETSFFNSSDSVSSKFFLQRKSLLQKSDEDDTAQPKLESNVQRSGLLEEQPASVQEKSLVQTSSDKSSPTTAPSSFESGLNSSKGGGSTLPDGVRSGMESGIGADFSGVKIHTGSQASSLNNQIGARAFTHGNDIYFNEGQYEPESQEGQHLLAHELTHTVQQGASVQTKPQELSSSTPKVQRIADWILEELNDYARYIPGWTLFTVIIGYNPLLRSNVDRSPENLVGGLLELIPVFGVLMIDKLREHNIFTDAFDWVRQRLSDLDLTTGRLERTIERAWDDVSIVRGLDYNIGVLDRTFGQLYRDVKAFANSIGSKVLELITNALLSALKYVADRVPGYLLLTKILGRDPITEEPVEATTVEILEDFLMLIGGEQELSMMREEGTLQETADWIDLNLAGLALAFDALKAAFFEVWDSFSFEDLRDPLAAFERAVDKLSEPATRVFQFAYNVAAKVVELIKNVLLRKLSEYASETRGYHLLTVLLGKDPFTGQDVPRNVENIIRGFMSLMSGGEQQFQQMKESGSIARTTERINAAVEELGFTWPYITGLFMELWNSFTINDIFNPFDAFVRIVETIASPIRRLFIFIIRIVKIVIEVFLEIMQFPTALIGQIIEKIQTAWELIKARPIEFIKNLLRGIKQGFVQFFNNIGTHLLNGLTGWLFKELGDAGITPPQDFSLGSILNLVMQVLGITMERVWQKIGEKIGPERMERLRGMVDQLQGAWQFIRDVMENGPSAIWTYVQDMLSNLWTLALDAVKNWVMTRIIQTVTTKLLSMLDPTGIMAVINSFIAIYNAIQSFIAYLREMLEVFNRFVDGVLATAQGNIQPAADKVEQSLGSTMPIVVGFLANQVGLGGLGRRVGEMIQALQERVDVALDWLIDRAIAAGRSVLNMGRNAIAAVRDWWTTRKELTTADGHDHTLYFEGSGTTSRLMIQSTPQTMNQYLDGIKNVHQIPETDLAAARAKALEIDTLKAQTVSEDQEQQHGATINTKVDELAALVQAIPLSGSTGTNTPPQYGPVRQGFGTFARVAYMESPHPMGSAPTVGNTAEYDLINARRQGSGSYYIKGHLLNENLMGPGNTWSNLTPLTQAANGDHKNNFENAAKTAVNGALAGAGARKFGYMKDFSVVANYGRSASGAIGLLRDTETDDMPSGYRDELDASDLANVLEAEQFVPTSLTCTVIVSDDGATERTVPYTVTNDIQYGNLAHYFLTAQPKTNFILADQVTEGDKPGSMARLQVLRQVGNVTAGKIYDVIVQYGRIPNFKRDIGITKKALETHNPRYRIKGSN